MRPGSPSIAALRAFEAAARLGSFRQAAEALGLTPSAVSHQVKSLEMDLGQALFVRERRGVRLTQAGVNLHPSIERGFAELAHGVAALQRAPERGLVRVTAPPAFASAVLAHRLHEFESRNPGLQLQLDVGNKLVDLSSAPVDVAIRCIRAPTGEFFGEELLPILSAPVCAPPIAKSLDTLGKLAGMTWLSSGQDRGAWRAWLRAAQCEQLTPVREIRYETLDALIQAAVDGVGIAIGPLGLLSPHLGAGRLVAPFAITIRSGFSYWLVCRRGEQDLPKVVRFRRWLTSAIGS